MRITGPRLAACQLVLALTIAGASTTLLLHLRTAALAQSEISLRGTSLLLADQAERAFEAVDLVENLLIKGLVREGTVTVEAFRARMAEAATYDMLAQRVSALPQLEAMYAADADGNGVASSRTADFGSEQVTVTDRDYFIALKADPTLGLFLSRPAAGRSTGGWTLYLARQARAPDGTFLGLLIGALNLNYFEELYANVVNGPDQAVSMFRTDSVLMVRYPHVAGPRIGETFSKGLAFTYATTPGTAVVVRKISAVDGQEKVIGATPLLRYPVIINVMDSVYAILAPWRVQASVIVGGAALIEFLALVLGVVALRYLRDQHQLGEARAAIALSLAREEAADQYNHLAHHDALTGLPNRLRFRDWLAQTVLRSKHGEAAAVLYLDLDSFKIVNDTLGHPIGDALLKVVAMRLRAAVREADFVARLGGDEFAIVLTNLAAPEDTAEFAKRLIAEISAPYQVDEHELTIGASVGIALIPGDGYDPDTLMKNADLALYRSKEQGRGCYRFFEPEMDAVMQTRRLNELYLRVALRSGEFEMFYQPLMNIQTRSVVGFEALVRWHHPARGLLQPGDFIPFAEEIGLIVPLGRWVLRQSCADAVTWPTLAKVAVNVSVLQFANHNTLVHDVTEALHLSGLPPERLELEITETVMLHDTDAVLALLHELRAIGVGIAMDDFGTGYSSLNYLRRFPFSKVKIDRSFVTDLGRDRDCQAIIAAVTGLCDVLGMTTLAEGVETEEQLAQLRAGNCGEAQGYLFSKPRPASEVAELCRTLGQAADVLTYLAPLQVFGSAATKPSSAPSAAATPVA